MRRRSILESKLKDQRLFNTRIALQVRLCISLFSIVSLLSPPPPPPPPHLSNSLSLCVSFPFSTPCSLTHERSMSLCIPPFLVPCPPLFVCLCLSLSLSLFLSVRDSQGWSDLGDIVCACLSLDPYCYLKIEDIWNIEGLITPFQSPCETFVFFEALTTCERLAMPKYPRKQRARAS